MLLASVEPNWQNQAGYTSFRPGHYSHCNIVIIGISEFLLFGVVGPALECGSVPVVCRDACDPTPGNWTI